MAPRGTRVEANAANHAKAHQSDGSYTTRRHRCETKGQTRPRACWSRKEKTHASTSSPTHSKAEVVAAMCCGGGGTSTAPTVTTTLAITTWRRLSSAERPDQRRGCEEGEERQPAERGETGEAAKREVVLLTVFVEAETRGGQRRFDARAARGFGSSARRRTASAFPPPREWRGNAKREIACHRKSLH